MKKSIYFICLCILMITFSCKTNNKVIIEGKLGKIAVRSLKLEEINAIPFELVDTISIQNQTFKFKNYIKNDGLYRLVFDENNVVYLYLKKGDHIKLKIDDKFFYNYSIEGNTESKQISTLIQYIAKNGAEIDTLAMQLQHNAMPKKEADSLHQILEKKEIAYIEYIKDFIAKQDNAAVAAFAINFFGPAAQQEMPYIVKTVDALSQKAPNSIYVKQFSDAIKVYKDAIIKDEQAGLTVGNKAPNIELQNWNGDTLNLKSLQGKYVLVDFWASWCPPCRAENPNVVKLYERYKNKGFEVFSVSLDEDENAWKNAVAKDKLSWQYHVSDLNGWQSATVKLYKIEAIPTTYLLDKSGKIIAKNLRGEALSQKLEELFKAQSTAKK
jgi:thiol-disulfide isomerase/thioredoxin